MEIRTATPADLAAVTALEAACFPPAEAAGEASFQARLAAFPDSFWLLVEGGRVLAMVNGERSGADSVRRIDGGEICD